MRVGSPFILLAAQCALYARPVLTYSGGFPIPSDLPEAVGIKVTTDLNGNVYLLGVGDSSQFYGGGFVACRDRYRRTGQCGRCRVGRFNRRLRRRRCGLHNSNRVGQVNLRIPFETLPGSHILEVTTSKGKADAAVNGIAAAPFLPCLSLSISSVKGRWTTCHPMGASRLGPSLPRCCAHFGLDRFRTGGTALRGLRSGLDGTRANQDPASHGSRGQRAGQDSNWRLAERYGHPDHRQLAAGPNVPSRVPPTGHRSRYPTGSASPKKTISRMG